MSMIRRHMILTLGPPHMDRAQTAATTNLCRQLMLCRRTPASLTKRENRCLNANSKQADPSSMP